MKISDKNTGSRNLTGGILLFSLAVFAAPPARAVMNGEGQDIFPVPAVFQASATITYSDPLNAGLTVSSGLVVTDGNVGISTGIPGARLHINTLATTAIGEIVQAAAAQTADLSQWQNSGGAPMLLVDRWGRLSYGSEVALQGAGISLLTSDVDQIGMVVRGLSGQNEDLQRWQAVGGVNLMVVRANGNIGISTGAPAARLDIVAAGSAQTDMVQIWRDSGGGIVSSMSATGVLKAAYFEGNGSGLTDLNGDDLGNHVATTTLQMGSYGIVSSSDITAARYQVNGSTVLALLRGANSLGVGIDAGQANTADNNSFVGYQAGYLNTSGGGNAFVGAQAGYSNGAGADNSIIGYLAGYTNTGSNNSFTGSHAGYFNEGTGGNSFFGSYSGYSNTTGGGNSFFGFNAGAYNSTAYGNSSFGLGAGRYTNGSANSVFGAESGGYGNLAAGNFSSSTIVGYQAGNKLQTGAHDNLLLGFKAGYDITTGTGNIIIGYDEATSAPGNSNELNIGGLLFGKLDSKVIGIARQVPQAALDIVSTGSAHTEMIQIWRDGGGSIVSSMSATGVMKAIRFVGNGSGLTNVPGSDNLGNHIATEQLQMKNFAIISSSDITAAHYQIDGIDVLFVPPGGGNLAAGLEAGGVNSTGYNNTFLGDQAGFSSIDAYSNTFIGFKAGYANNGGSGNGNNNAFIGSVAGTANIDGNSNVFLGAAAGYLNTYGSNNTFLGYNAGNSNTTGAGNTFVGNTAGNSNDASYNSYLGFNAGYYNISGGYNVVLGAEAGVGNDGVSTYSNSTIIGYFAGTLLETGNNNIFIGYNAGNDVTTGGGNIVIGYNQDTSAATANNELNIGGLLYGDLSAKTIGISTRMPQAALDIVSTGTTANVMAQIWRNNSGVIIGSMSATGAMTADTVFAVKTVATDTSTSRFHIPKLSTAVMLTLSPADAGDLYYNKDRNVICVSTGTTQYAIAYATDTTKGCGL